jgi:hypothetical protein
MELHDISYIVSYRDIKYPRLELRTGELLLVLPFGYEPEVLLNKHKDWIFKKIDFIEKCLKDSSNKEIINRTEKKFKALIYSFVKKISKELGIGLNKLYFRKMKTKWASCSFKRNLTINTLMRYLPEYLIEYIIFHEIVHIIEKKHNDKFWGIISKRFNNYQQFERDLFTYWFRICKQSI